MEPGSRTDNPLGQTSSQLANVIGTLIALMTLVLPMMAIAHYSSDSSPSFLTTPSVQE